MKTNLQMIFHIRTLILIILITCEWVTIQANRVELGSNSSSEKAVQHDFFTSRAERINPSETDTKWKAWKMQFGKVYSSADEEASRRGIWEDRLLHLRLHNMRYLTGLESFAMRMNGLADQTETELSETLLLKGLRTSWQNGAEVAQGLKKSSMIFTDSGRHMFPEMIDWDKEGRVTAVKDGTNCTSSWAIAAVGVLEGQWLASAHKPPSNDSLSFEQILDCSTCGRNSTSLNDAFNYAIQNGLESEIVYASKRGMSVVQYANPGCQNECHYKQEDVVYKPKQIRYSENGNSNKLKTAVARFGPVAAYLSVDVDFMFYGSGVYPCKAQEPNHAVLIVGYSTADIPIGTGKPGRVQKYWKVKNSWRSDWGEAGYARIKDDDKEDCNMWKKFYF